MKGKECVVLACERRTTLKLQDPRITPSKINRIDNHVQLAFAGLNADARILIDKARVEAQSYKLTLEDPVTIEYLTRYVAGVQQRFTQSGGTRPFGIATLIAGFDPNDKTPRLYMTEPSGIYSAWKANAIGRNGKTVREYLEKNYGNKRTKTTKKDTEKKVEDADQLEQEMSDERTIRLAIEALLEVVQTGAKNIELSLMKPDGMRFLSDEEIAKVVKEIDDDKAAEAERKKKHRRAD